MMTTTRTASWPPEYTLKRNKRSRHVRFKISVGCGLEIVVPERFSAKKLPQILDEKRAWIEKHLADVQHQQHVLAAAKAETPLPTELNLLAIGENWSLEYIQAPFKPKLYLRPHQQLAVLGKLDDHALIYAMLKHWLKRTAERQFKQHLSVLSEQMRCNYQKLIVRDQKTRWGSCNSKKTISLNFKLLFFPPELMRYVMVHELCHTVHLNHSPKFWQMVAKFDPNYSYHRKALQQPQQYLPFFLGES